MRCTFCEYEIKDANQTPRYEPTRRNAVAFGIGNKRLTGSCSDGQQETLYEE